MQSKFGLVALSVMATLVLFGGNTAEAKSEATTNKPTPVPVVVTVKPGDNLSDIATSQNTSYMRMFNANESITNPDLIFADQQLRVPSSDEQLPDRLAQFSAEQQAQILAAAATQQATIAPSATPIAQAATAPAAAAAPVSMSRGTVAGNGYTWGQCTWYVKNMRPDLPNNLGNGGQWVRNAAAQGLPTGNVPRVGAVAEEPGHVAYVEAVNGGMISISEMNYAGGVGQVHRRTVPAANYRYIY